MIQPLLGPIFQIEQLSHRLQECSGRLCPILGYLGTQSPAFSIASREMEPHLLAPSDINPFLPTALGAERLSGRPPSDSAKGIQTGGREIRELPTDKTLSHALPLSLVINAPSCHPANRSEMLVRSGFSA